MAVILTGAGSRAFCTGGNTKEYAEYYANKPTEYGSYIDIFWDMIDTMLSCRKPTICRVNGMRVAGGQEICVTEHREFWLATACSLVADMVCHVGRCGAVSNA